MFVPGESDGCYNAVDDSYEGQYQDITMVGASHSLQFLNPMYSGHMGSVATDEAHYDYAMHDDAAYSSGAGFPGGDYDPGYTLATDPAGAYLSVDHAESSHYSMGANNAAGYIDSNGNYMSLAGNDDAAYVARDQINENYLTLGGQPGTYGYGMVHSGTDESATYGGSNSVVGYVSVEGVGLVPDTQVDFDPVDFDPSASYGAPNAAAFNPYLVSYEHTGDVSQGYNPYSADADAYTVPE